MRTLEIGTRKYTEVEVLDEKGQGNANHKYQIVSVSQEPEQPVVILGNVSFQNGPIKETGVNGVMNEDLLVIVLDRLEGFQSGDYACKENERAWASIRTGLDFLNERTSEREKRGVEGTHTI